ncbi:CHAT domain-containing protein [Anabaena sp. UHCC 0204]|uniref:CHAT domain-containing protein n=1 Tax=Anabaena sp. UHCC 0204 TaxID=2590009 RepID=UPI001444E462|nr:CHAT domain-containing protein [Anabaena sp. UHCC 0204]MTJ06702.1 CHAT domain-containing protein [Anabaena sp. UHCC 0204]
MISLRKKLLLLGILLMGLFPQSVKAQSVTSATDGTGTVINQNGNQIDITGGTLSQDQINLFHSFTQFGLNQHEIANFLSNPQIKNILGRVVGGDASIINGLIQVTGANSNLFLINPSGIIFGANSQLNVPANFTATTATGIGFGNNLWFNATGLNNYATLLGDPSQFAFNINQPGSIINTGSLQVGTGQNLSLIGGNVISTGTLTAPEGNITIASVPGTSLVKISQPGHLLSLEVNPTQTSAPSNITGLSLPELLTGGNVSQATGVTVDSNGEVVLTSSGVIVPADGGTTIASGNIDVSGQTGGKVNVLGEKVGVIDGNINASGTNGGGTVLIGGDYQGNGTVPNSQFTFVNSDSTINADALINGDGGKVIFWADNTTRFYGNINAQGGSTSGNGGFVEVSGKEFLDFNGQVNTFAVNGNLGTLLLDPTDINIVAAGGSASLANVSVFSNPNSDGISSNINADLINNATSNVILQAEGSIWFETGINITQPGVGLTAQARDYILLNNITTNGGSLNIIADVENNGIGSIQDGLNYSLITNGGDINLQGGGATSDSSVELEAVTINSGGGNITLTGINNDATEFPAISIDYSSSISSGGGNITLNGTSDGTGIFIQGANINSGGGSLTLTGNGVNGDGIFLESVSLNSGGGNLSLSANSTNSVDFSALAVNINSGIGNLSLTADTTDIDPSNNSFSGTGNLLIQPLSVNLGMTIGGGGAANTTFLNNAELASFTNGFNSITIGRADSSGAVTFAGNTTFNDPITVRSPLGSINSTGFTLTGSDNATITLLAGIGGINSGNIFNSSRTVTLDAIGNITTGEIDTSVDLIGSNINGGAIQITSGSNITTGTLKTEIFNGLGTAGNITLNTTGSTGSINTTGGTLDASAINGSGGTIFVFTQDGDITTGNIITFSNTTVTGSQGGNIFLTVNSGNGNINTTGGSLNSGANNDGSGGAITLTTANGNINTGDILSTSRLHNGGDITLEVTGTGNIDTSAGTLNSSSTDTVQFNGNGGDISLSTTGTINTGNLNAVSNTGGSGGEITLAGQDINSNAAISTTGTGNVQFDANRSITLNSGSRITTDNGNINFTGDDIFLVNSSGLETTGIGNINLDTTRSINIYSGSSITTDSGNIVLNANQIGTNPGNFAGIFIDNSTIQSNNGEITLSGKGGDQEEINTGNDGVLVQNSNITSNNGSITFTGVSGQGSVNTAVEFFNSTVATGGTGNITIDGDSATNNGDYAVLLRQGTQITSTGSGQISLTGTAPATKLGIYGEGSLSSIINQTGDITLTTDTLDLTNISLQGTGNLTLQPLTPNTTIGLGNGAIGTFNLNSTAIGNLQDGFNSIIIGRSDSSGVITLADNLIFNDPVILRSPLFGTVAINNSITTPAITFEATTFIGGDITTINPQTYNYPVIFTNNSTITTNGITFNNTVDGNKNLTINAGGADVIFTQAVGNIETLGDLNINSSGKTSFANVNAASITTDASGLTELNGNIQAIGGNINLNDTVNLINNTTLTADNSISTNSINGNYDLSFSAGGDINFNSDLGNNLTLGNLAINQAINVTGKNINAASITQTFGIGNTTLGDLNTNQSGLNLRTNQNITTGNITANGQEITLTSQNITTNNLNSSSANGGGDINILAQNQIITGQIDSSSSIGNGGNVTIDPITTIITSINTQGGTNGFGGNVDIIALDTFRSTGTFIDQNGISASISTAGGLGGGDITIYHPGVLPFIIGNADIHGTAGAITSGVNNTIMPTLPVLSTYTQENIRLFSLNEEDIEPPVIDKADNVAQIGTEVTNLKPLLVGSEFLRQTASNQLIQGDIAGAVSSIEQFISGEYTEYYQEKLELNAQPQTAETIRAALKKIALQTGKQSAIVYIISQPESLDLVVITPAGKAIHRNVKFDRKQIIADVKTFRNQITDLSSVGYQQSGKKLYNSLIAPIEAVLTAEKIDTLLFSVDNNLRSLPFAALYDGKNYLVEKYNMGLIPSVSLMDTRYESLKNSQILIMGASDFANSNQDDLPGVKIELPTVAKEFGENRYFINQEFTINNLQKQRQQRVTQIVHLATHGEFNIKDPNQSYIQFWGTEKLKINQIRNLGFRNPPVELLVLSACRTALGNEQVELGFAGLAVQAGVKSALASLWYVSDEGTLGLMNEFYQKLRNVPIKSEALRQAQIAMIQDKVNVTNGELRGTRGDISLPPELKGTNKSLSHPYYWAAFTMIGSPW